MCEYASPLSLSLYELEDSRESTDELVGIIQHSRISVRIVLAQAGKVSTARLRSSKHIRQTKGNVIHLDSISDGQRNEAS